MLTSLTARIVAFRDARDWSQFHTPRHLASAISIEAAELQEILLWKTDDNVSHALEDPVVRERLSDELADVLIYALLLCHETGIEPERAIEAKLEKNEVRYPAVRARGSAKKYTEL